MRGDVLRCFHRETAALVTFVDPNALGRGVTHDIAVTGTHFRRCCADDLVSDMGHRKLTPTFSIAATSLHDNVTVASDAAPGTRDVTVSNQTAGRPRASCVLHGRCQPTITSATPDHFGQGCRLSSGCAY